ncbi:MAG: nucleotide exchange factor GrpE [Chloroflexi bacterium]|nr:nucleotide exchange factor GrpE [Chloroflexota bacterium]MCC6893833.1 nucleotide exchange factor GrpE [Anaerolineae bacterium]
MSQEETTQFAAEDSGTPKPEEGTPVPDINLAEVLATARKEAAEFKEGWLRERADFNNYKKRIETQMKDMRDAASVEALLTLLPIIDDFERAMANVPAELQTNPWINGVGGIHRKFQKALEDKGVTVLDPVGQVFDPTRHEAVVTEESSEVESGHVIATLQKGYARGERILRPALVKIAI